MFFLMEGEKVRTQLFRMLLSTLNDYCRVCAVLILWYLSSVASLARLRESDLHLLIELI